MSTFEGLFDKEDHHNLKKWTTPKNIWVPFYSFFEKRLEILQVGNWIFPLAPCVVYFSYNIQGGGGSVSWGKHWTPLNIRLHFYLRTYFKTNINICWVNIVRRKIHPQNTVTPPDLDHLQFLLPPSECMIYISHHKKNELVPIFQFLKKIVCQRSLVSYCNQWNRVSYFTKKHYSISNQCSTLIHP